jgi:hypothetical protein
MMPHQKRSILLKKCFRSMMLGLGANVCLHIIKLGLAYGTAIDQNLRGLRRFFHPTVL